MASWVNLCVIDEALSLLINHVASDQWDHKEILPLRKALTTYLETMKETYKYNGKIDPSNPKPDLSLLSASKVELVEEVKTESRRKELWFQILKSKGWTWDEVYPVNKKGDVEKV